MDHNLVRSWLDLPPGPWPPDHYSLLGLPLGQSDPAQVEPLVLDRMDRLRRHQLLHPEVVTEGMNRLAQALITLTDPKTKAAYDTELGIVAASSKAAKPPRRPRTEEVSRTAPVVIAQPVIDDVFPDDVPVGLPANLHDTHEVQIPSFEVVEKREPHTAEFVVSDQELLDVPVASQARPSPIDDAVEASPVSLQRDVEVKNRRWIYARLALLRRAIHDWDLLGIVFTDPENRLERPGQVLLLLEPVAAIRVQLGKLRGIIGGFGEPGGLVCALIRHPMNLSTIRQLLADQREAVKTDWSRGQVELHREYQRLRQLSRRRRDESTEPPTSVILGRWLRENPEWGPIILALLLLLFAMFRAT